MRLTRADQVADYDEASSDPDPNPQALAPISSRAMPRLSQTGPYRLLGVMLVRLRIAEICKGTISHVLGHIAAKPANHFIDAVGNSPIFRAFPPDQGERSAPSSRPDRRT